MARSIFKRVIKMSIKEVRKSVAGLAMGNPFGKGKLQQFKSLWSKGLSNGRLATT
jgi:hypothetical protein